MSRILAVVFSTVFACVAVGSHPQSSSADVLNFVGNDWTAANHGRTFIGGGDDPGWTMYDDGTFGNNSRQQWIWMDVAAALSDIPAGREVVEANLTFPGVRFVGGGSTSVEFGIFEVPGTDRGRAAVIAAGGAGRDGNDVPDYYSENTNYGTVSGVTGTFAPQSFDVTELVEGWRNGTLTTNPGQMNILWNSRIGNNYSRWGNTESDGAEVAAGNRPWLQIVTAHDDLHVTLGNDPSSTATNANDATPRAAFIDLTNAEILSAGGTGIFAVNSWDFDVTTAQPGADVIPFLARRNDGGGYEVIWSGTEVDGALLGTLGSYNVEEGATFSLSEDTVVYAGLWSSIADGRQPIGFLDGSGLSWLNYNLPGSVPEPSAGHVYGTGGAVGQFARTYDFQINVSSVPEPSTWALLGIGGALGAGLMRRRRNRQASAGGR